MDVIAVLSLVGTLLVGEYLAGALIAVMLAGGRALDAAAAAPRVPRSAGLAGAGTTVRAATRRRRKVSVIPLAEVARR